MELVHKCAGSFRGKKYTEPDRILGIHEPSLACSWNVGQSTGPLAAVYGKRGEFAVLDQRQDQTDWTKKEIYPPDHSLRHRFRAAPEGDVQSLDTGAGYEPFCAEMGRGSRTNRRKGHSARFRPGSGDQIARSLEALLGCHDKDTGRGSQGDHCSKIERRIVAKPWIESRCDGMRIGINQQRIPVGINLGRVAGSDRTTCPTAILYHDAPANPWR